jgi:TrmH family RNA methyltransferase
MRTITSRQNPVVRAFRDTADHPDMAGRRLLLDGMHLVRDAHAAGIPLEHVVVTRRHLEERADEAAFLRDLERQGTDVITVGDTVMSAVSPVRSPSGIVALAVREPINVEAICTATRALVVVAVGIQDPGNLGALLRAAEAGGATGVIVCGASAHPFSWKALRGSMGSALRVPTAVLGEVADALGRLQRAGVQTVATTPRTGAAPSSIDWSQRTAVFLGAEGTGLPGDVIDGCDAHVSIPMEAPVESLNVAVATALLVYEARRQRR